MALNDIKQGFGVVTVFNATCVPVELLNTATSNDGGWEAYCKQNYPSTCAKKVLSVYNANTTKCCKIDTLKVANINVEGPSKTITGGQYANPLIKFGKTATCEMQDALGHYDALNILGGVELDSTKQMHFTSKFGKPVAIVGDTFIIDRETGDQVKVMEIIYQFLPNSIISLTQASDGDATVFDLNGSLMATDVAKTIVEDTGVVTALYHGTFYSIIDPVTATTSYTYTLITESKAAEEGGETLYIKSADGAYVPVTIAGGTTIPADTYYTRTTA